MPLMTKKDYAKHHGCTPAYISKRDVSARLQPAMEKQPDGKWLINSETADAILKDTQDPAGFLGRADKEQAPLLNDPNSYTAARSRRETVKGHLDQLDLEERLGRTLSKAEVYAAASKAGGMIREHLQGRNRLIAQQLSTMTDIRQIKSFLDESDRTILETISNDFLRKLQGSDSGSDPGTDSGTA